MHPNQQERKIIYKVKSGSILYGTNTPQSDEDFVSVFMPTAYDLFSLQKCDFIDNSTKSSKEDRRNTNEDIDDQQHSLQRYLHLVLHANPNLTEILFANNIIIEDPIFSEIKENYSKLISQRAYDSFTGFAISQKKKLEYKSKRYLQLITALEYLQSKYSESDLINSKIVLGKLTSTWLNMNLNEYKGEKNNIEHFNKGLSLKVIYEKIESEYNRYGWRVKTKEFERLSYDVKFASHAIRLFYEGEQLLLNGKLEFPITGEAYDDIMKVKNAEASIEEFYEICNKYEERNRIALTKTQLPKQPDWKWTNNWLVKTLTKWIKEGE